METLLVILLALVFICGAPLFTIMFAATALGALFSERGFDVNVNGAISKMFRISSRSEIEVLSTIPLFIFAGYVLAESKTADRLVRFANAAMGWLPGGLAIVTIGTCALFTVFTGASGVTIIALGGVLMPALVKNGYPKKFSMGLIAGTGAVGLLFPPALPLFIFGTVYGLNAGPDASVWSTERFIFAGIVPGLVLIAMLSAVAMAVAIKRRLPRQPFDAGELGRSFVKALPELFIPFGVIIGIANGIPVSDVAALTVLYVIVLETAVFRTISFRQIWALAPEAMAMIGAIFAIIFASTAFTDFLVQAQVPDKMVEWTQAHVSSKIVFLLAINVILLIVGTVMDIFSAIVVVLPLVAPIARQYGIDPYHLGVIFLLNLEVGYLHPPVGLNLFLTSVKFQRPVVEVMWATMPFLITMIVALFIISYVPQLTITTKDPTSFPEAPRTAPIKNLLGEVQDGIVEVGITVEKVPLVDSSGVPLVDSDGKPIVRTFDLCRTQLTEIKKGLDAKRAAGDVVTSEMIDDSRKPYIACRQLFVAVSTCKGDVACANKATAKWTVDVLNDEDHPESAVITIKELAYLNKFGDPISEDVLDGEGKVVETKVIGADKDGKPFVRTLAWCDTLLYKADRERCHGLFIEASKCRISYDDVESVEECAAEKCGGETPTDEPTEPAPGEGSGSAGSAAAGSAAGSGSAGSDAAGSAEAGSADAAGSAGSGSAGSGSAGSGSAAGSGDAATPPPAGDCKRNALAECVREDTAIKECIATEVEGWVKANKSVALNPPLRSAAEAAADNAANKPKAKDVKSGGCSTSDASLGVLFVGATLIVLYRRRRRTAA